MEFRVLFDFVPEEDGELPVSSGDLLFQLEPDLSDECPPGWIFVRKDLGNGVIRGGYVPRDFLQLVGSSTYRAGASHDEGAGAGFATAKQLTSTSDHRSREAESSSGDPSSMVFSRGGAPLPMTHPRPDDHPPPSANKIVDISHFLPPGSSSSSTPLRDVMIPSTPMVATRGGAGTEAYSAISTSKSSTTPGYFSSTAAASVHRAVVADTTTSDLMDVTRRAESLLEQILSGKSELVAGLSSLSSQLSASAQASDELLRSISLVETSLDSEIAAILAEGV